MFDDDAGRRLKLPHAFQRGIGIGDVVERQLAPLRHVRVGDVGFVALVAASLAIAIKRRALMRVLAIAQRVDARERQQQLGRKQPGRRLLRLLQISGHARVIACGVRKGLGRQTLPCGKAAAACGPQLGQQRRIVGRVNQHRDGLMVLGRTAQHGRTSDVDVLDGFVIAAVSARDSAGKRIEVDHQQVDGCYAVFGHHGFVDAAPTQQAAVYARMQRLDASAHDLGKAGVFGHFAHR